MLLPQLTPNKQTTETVDQFLGYNHNLRIRSGEFYDMQNLSPDYFPTLCPRGPRGSYEYPVGMTVKTQGIIHKDQLYFVNNGHVYANGVELNAGFTVSATGTKQLVSMGAYLLIFPDNKYINTSKRTEYGDMGATFYDDETEKAVTYSLCNVDGTDYNAQSGSTAPTNPTGGEYWIDTSENVHVLKQYSDTSSMWIQVPTTYIKIATPGIAASFSAGDGVKISNLPDNYSQLKELEGKTSVIQCKDEENNGYIVVIGMLDVTITGAFSKIKVERQIPTMDFVIESNNRLWGCFYGEQDGKIVNEIYASKLGDFKNWRCYEGVSTDSYSVSCGTDGQWTGAISYMGYPTFFKEDVMHKIYGNYPANYQVQTTECIGVQKGAGNSLAIVCETLFYKARSGVCMYNGSLPKKVSDAFGDIHYSALDDSYNSQSTTTWQKLRCGAAAGDYKSRYYISMRSEADNNWYLFVYDINTGLWHKQDNVHADSFCEHDGELYYIDHSGAIKTMFGSGVKETSPVAWFAETGPIETEYSKRQTLNKKRQTLNKKYVNKLLIRMSMDIGSQMNIFIQYDSRGEWENIGRVTVNNLRTFSYTIKPKRCNHFKLRFGGIGKVNIYTIIRCYTQGSDV